MDVKNLHAIVTASQETIEGETIPAGFAAAALVTTPLPEGSAPQALLAGAEQNLAQYTSEDLEGLLAAADQIGLIDLSRSPAITLSEVRMDTLAGLPALYMDGSLGYESSSVHIQVWLCWTANLFVAYDEVAESQSWQEDAASFEAIRNSITFP